MSDPATSPLDRPYNPQECETQWTDAWQEAGVGAPTGEGDPYCIMLPPPNVTGFLHMGHGFQVAIMDALIRYHKKRGFDTHWQLGFDHAGIATQLVVERMLEDEGLSRREIGREAFETRVWAWKERSSGHIRGQLRSLGVMADWSQERFTLDDGMQRAVKEAFVRLYREDLIAQAPRLVNWDPVVGTALSDLEVKPSLEQGSMWTMAYALEGGGQVSIATTRPETLLADMAVAVHPDDERYASVVGRMVVLPLTERTVPVVADAFVDPEFGTGCVKITPGHDFHDYEVGERLGLSLDTKGTGQVGGAFAPASMFDLKAHVLGGEPADLLRIPDELRGLSRDDARRRVLEMLGEQGIEVMRNDHQLQVPRGDRGGAILEPMVTRQWFMKTDDLAAQAIAAEESGSVQFVPEQWRNTFRSWMREPRDWCISRQLWWGHRVPAWRTEDGQVIVGVDEADARAHHGIADDAVLTPDEDVLDTWFSAGLWTFATLGWPEKTERLARFHPTNVLVTGFDIIYFWVARMIMLSGALLKEVPFRDVMVTGLIRDSRGDKMSKSKGNVLDPLDLINGIELETLVAKRVEGMMLSGQKKHVEKQTRKDFPGGITAHGTDALRLTFLSLASGSRDVNFSVGRLAGARNFCNKLWNAARFVVRETGEGAIDSAGPEDYAARYVRAKLAEAMHAVEQAVSTYRFDEYARVVQAFGWHLYCDWYIEMAKHRMRDGQASAGVVLRDVLDGLLDVLHPAMPFVTEEIASQLPWRREPEMLVAARPMAETVAPADIASPADITQFEWMQGVVKAVRNVRSELGISPAKALDVAIVSDDATIAAALDVTRGDIQSLAGCGALTLRSDDVPGSAVQYVDSVKVMVPLEGLVDPKDELKRVTKKLEEAQAHVTALSKRLSSPKFVSGAPADVVDSVRQRLQTAETAVIGFERQLEAVSQLTR